MNCSLRWFFVSGVFCLQMGFVHFKLFFCLCCGVCMSRSAVITSQTFHLCIVAQHFGSAVVCESHSSCQHEFCIWRSSGRRRSMSSPSWCQLVTTPWLCCARQGLVLRRCRRRISFGPRASGEFFTSDEFFISGGFLASDGFSSFG